MKILSTLIIAIGGLHMQGSFASPLFTDVSQNMDIRASSEMIPIDEPLAKRELIPIEKTDCVLPVTYSQLGCQNYCYNVYTWMNNNKFIIGNSLCAPKSGSSTSNPKPGEPYYEESWNVAITTCLECDPDGVTAASRLIRQLMSGCNNPNGYSEKCSGHCLVDQNDKYTNPETCVGHCLKEINFLKSDGYSTIPATNRCWTVISDSYEIAACLKCENGIGLKDELNRLIDECDIVKSDKFNAQICPVDSSTSIPSATFTDSSYSKTANPTIAPTSELNPLPLSDRCVLPLKTTPQGCNSFCSSVLTELESNNLLFGGSLCVPKNASPNSNPKPGEMRLDPSWNVLLVPCLECDPNGSTIAGARMKQLLSQCNDPIPEAPKCSDSCYENDGVDVYMNPNKCADACTSNLIKIKGNMSSGTEYQYCRAVILNAANLGRCLKCPNLGKTWGDIIHFIGMCKMIDINDFKINICPVATSTIIDSTTFTSEPTSISDMTNTSTETYTTDSSDVSKSISSQTSADLSTGPSTTAMSTNVEQSTTISNDITSTSTNEISSSTYTDDAASSLSSQVKSTDTNFESNSGSVQPDSETDILTSESSTITTVVTDESTYITDTNSIESTSDATTSSSEPASSDSDISSNDKTSNTGMSEGSTSTNDNGSSTDENSSTYNSNGSSSNVSSNTSTDGAGASSTDGSGASSTDGSGISQTEGSGASSSDGAGASSTDGAGASSTDGSGISQTDGSGASSTDGAGASSSDGAGASFTDGSGISQTDGSGASSTDGSGASSSDGAGASSTDDSGASSTDDSGASSTDGAGASSTDGSGISQTDGSGASSSDGAGASSTDDSGASSTDDSGASSTDGSGASSTDGSGIPQTDGAGASSTDGSGASSTDGSGISQTDGSGASSSDGAGASSTDGAGASSTDGSGASSTDGSGISQTDGSGASSSDGAGASSTDDSGASSTDDSGASSTDGSGASSTDGSGISQTDSAGASSTDGAGASSTDGSSASSSDGAGASFTDGSGISQTDGSGASSTDGSGASSTDGSGFSSTHGATSNATSDASSDATIDTATYTTTDRSSSPKPANGISASTGLSVSDQTASSDYSSKSSTNNNQIASTISTSDLATDSDLHSSTNSDQNSVHLTASSTSFRIETTFSYSYSISTSFTPEDTNSVTTWSTSLSVSVPSSTPTTVIPGFTIEECKPYCEYVDNQIDKILNSDQKCSALNSIDEQLVANCLRCLGQYLELYKPGESAKNVFDSIIACDIPPSQKDYDPIRIPGSTVSSGSKSASRTDTTGPNPTQLPYTKDQCNKYCEYLSVELDKSSDTTQKCAVLGTPNEQYVENCLRCVESYPELTEPSQSGRKVKDQLEQCQLPNPGGPYEEVPLPGGNSGISTGTRTSSSSGSTPTDESIAPENKCSIYCLYITRQLELSPLLEQCSTLNRIEEQIIANCYRCQELYQSVAVSEPVQKVNEAFEQCKIEPSDKPYEETDIVTNPGHTTGSQSVTTDGATQSQTQSNTRTSSQSVLPTLTPPFTIDECKPYCKYINDQIDTNLSGDQKCDTLSSIDDQLVANCLRCLGQYLELYKPGESAKNVFDSIIACDIPPSQKDYDPIPIPGSTVSSGSKSASRTDTTGPNPTQLPYTKDQCNKYCEYLSVELDKSSDTTQKCVVLGTPNEQYVENCLRCVESYPELAEPSQSGRKVKDQLEQCQLPNPGGPYEEVPLPGGNSGISTGTRTSSSSGSTPTDVIIAPENKCSIYCLYITRQLELSPLLEQCSTLNRIEEQIIANCYRCQELYQSVAVSEPVQKVNEAFEQCKIEPSDKPYNDIDIVTTPGHTTKYQSTTTPATNSVSTTKVDQTQSTAVTSTRTSTSAPGPSHTHQFTIEQCNPYCVYVDGQISSISNPDMRCSKLDSIDEQLVANCLRCVAQYIELYVPGQAAKNVFDELITCQIAPSVKPFDPIPIPGMTSSSNINSKSTSSPFVSSTLSSVTTTHSTDSHTTQSVTVSGSEQNGIGSSTIDMVSSKTSQTTDSTSTDNQFTQEQCSIYCMYISNQLESSSTPPQYCSMLQSFDEQIIANCFRCAEKYSEVAESLPGKKVTEAYNGCNLAPVERSYKETPIGGKQDSSTTMKESGPVTSDSSLITSSFVSKPNVGTGIISRSKSPSSNGQPISVTSTAKLPSVSSVRSATQVISSGNDFQTSMKDGGQVLSQPNQTKGNTNSATQNGITPSSTDSNVNPGSNDNGQVGSKPGSGSNNNGNGGTGSAPGSNENGHIDSKPDSNSNAGSDSNGQNGSKPGSSSGSNDNGNSGSTPDSDSGHGGVDQDGSQPGHVSDGNSNGQVAPKPGHDSNTESNSNNPPSSGSKNQGFPSAHDGNSGSENNGLGSENELGTDGQPSGNSDSANSANSNEPVGGSPSTSQSSDHDASEITKPSTDTLESSGIEQSNGGNTVMMDLRLGFCILLFFIYFFNSVF